MTKNERHRVKFGGRQVPAWSVRVTPVDHRMQNVCDGRISVLLGSTPVSARTHELGRDADMKKLRATGEMGVGW
jgi:hypothetical protein